jgi:hypothetical protein
MEMLDNNATQVLFMAMVDANLIGKHFPLHLAHMADELAAHLKAGGTPESYWAEYVFAPIDDQPLRRQTAEELAGWAMTLLMVAPALKRLANVGEIAEAIVLVSAHVAVRKTPLLAAVFHLIAKELDILVMPKAFGIGRDALAALTAQ